MIRTPSTSVARSAASLLSSRLLVAGIALIFLGVSTRLLTLSEIAVFAVYNTLCGAITVVCSLGLLASCIKQVPLLAARGEEAAVARLLSVSIRVYLIGALALGLVLWAAAPSIGGLLLKDEGRAPDVRVAVAAALCFGLYEASQLLLSALQRFGDFARFNVITALTQRSLSLGLFFAFGLKGYLAGFAAGSLAGAALGFSRILPHARMPSGERSGPESPGASSSREIRFAFPFYVDGYLRYLYMHADQLLVGILLPPAALSLYFVAKRFLQYCQVVVSSLVDPLGARAAELSAGRPEELARTAAGSLRWTVLLFLPLAVLLACLSPFLLAVVGGRPYAEGAWPLSLLFLSVPVFAVFSLLGVLVHALGDPVDRLKVNLMAILGQAASIVLLGGGLRWVGWSSLVAALGALAAARAAGFGVGAIYARRLLRRRLGAALIIAPATFAGAAIPTLAMAAAILLPHVWLGRPLLLPLYAAPALLLCYAGYRWLVLEPEDTARLAGSIPVPFLRAWLLARVGNE